MSDFLCLINILNLIMSKLYFWERWRNKHERERKWPQWDIENSRDVECREQYLQDLEARHIEYNIL